MNQPTTVHCPFCLTPIPADGPYVHLCASDEWSGTLDGQCITHHADQRVVQTLLSIHFNDVQFQTAIDTADMCAQALSTHGLHYCPNLHSMLVNAYYQAIAELETNPRFVLEAAA